MSCPSATIDTTNPVVIINGVANFTVSDFPATGEICSVSQVLLAGFSERSAINCDNLSIGPNNGPTSCTFEDVQVLGLPVEIDTIGSLGLLVMSLLLLVSGTLFFRRN